MDDEHLPARLKNPDLGAQEHDGVSVTALSSRPASTAGFHAIFLVVEALIVALVAVLGVAARKHPGPFVGDVGVERAVQSALLPHAALTDPLEALSTLNWPVPTAITLGIIVAVFLVLRRWLDAIVLPVAAAVESVVTLQFSKWIHRPRPTDHGIHILQKITGSYSFPSGHVTYAFAIFGLLLFLTTRVRHPFHPALVWMLRAVLLVLIVLMPISRVLEGEHWPSDTLGGALNGLFWLILFAHVYLWARSRWPVLLAADER